MLPVCWDSVGSTEVAGSPTRELAPKMPLHGGAEQLTSGATRASPAGDRHELITSKKGPY